MKHIFYFIVICFIISEVKWLLSPLESTARTKKMKDLAKENKSKKWDDFPQEFKDLIIHKGAPGMLFIIWMFAGLMTFNWAAFAVFILFNFAVISPLSKLSNFGALYVAANWINSLIGVVFGAFVIINSYHLKIDLFEVIKNWLF